MSEQTFASIIAQEMNRLGYGLHEGHATSIAATLRAHGLDMKGQLATALDTSDARRKERDDVMNLLAEQQTALAACRFLLGKYAPSHHWLHHVDKHIHEVLAMRKEPGYELSVEAQRAVGGEFTVTFRRVSDEQMAQLQHQGIALDGSYFEQREGAKRENMELRAALKLTADCLQAALTGGEVSAKLAGKALVKAATLLEPPL